MSRVGGSQYMPPPVAAVLPENVQSYTFRTAELKLLIPPPVVPPDVRKLLATVQLLSATEDAGVVREGHEADLEGSIVSDAAPLEAICVRDGHSADGHCLPRVHEKDLEAVCPVDGQAACAGASDRHVLI